MNLDDLNRRQFGRLSMAAFGGLVSGAALTGCKKEDAKPTPKPDDAKPAAGGAKPTDDAAKAQTAFWVEGDKHVCRGLNNCKGKGKGGMNECAGAGACASVAHECGGQNDCKGLGGCGATPGENACKGMGDCSVPLMEKKWPVARKRFEEAMTKANKKFSPAPAAAPAAN